jgi:hypothetical protein
MMQAKYVIGAKVRITMPNSLHSFVSPEILHYDNQIGEIVRSLPVLAFIVPQPPG